MDGGLTLSLVLAAGTAILLWVVQRELGPLALVLMLCALWWPIRRSRTGRTVGALLLLLLALWIVHQARWVVYSLLGGILIAYVLAPLVEWLHRPRLPRPVAAFIALLPIVCLIVLALVLLIPALIAESVRLIRHIPQAYDLVESRLGPLLIRIGALKAGPAAPGAVSHPILDQVTAHVEMLLKTAVGGLIGVGKEMGRLAQWIAVALLMPVIAYYLLLDWVRLRDGTLAWMPARWHGAATRLATDLQIAFQVYFRGQTAIAVIEAVLLSLAFRISGLPQPIALGVLAALLLLLPIIGFWVTMILVALTALTGPAPWGTLIKGVITMFAMNLLEGQVLTPRIQGRGLGLHPLVVLLGVLTSGLLFGFLGLILAVPTMGAIKASLPEIRAAWMNSRFYTGQSPDPPLRD